MIRLSSMILLFTVAGQATVSPRAESPRETTSLIALIGSPERFDGKRVRLIGYLDAGFEVSALYLHEEDFKRDLPQNSVALDLGPFEAAGAKASRKYVLVEGTYSAPDPAFANLKCGELRYITRLEIWTPTQPPRRPK